MLITKPEPMSDKEVQNYVKYIQGSFHKQIKSLDIKIAEDNNEEVELSYEFEPIRFERIRRITGYLVGSLDTWNDGKRAEEYDRVKHEVKETL